MSDYTFQFDKGWSSDYCSHAFGERLIAREEPPFDGGL